MLPSARSQQWFRKAGYICANVEKRLHIPGAPWPRTVDCFNFGDLLVAKAGFGVALVQVTASGMLARREAKILAMPVSKADFRSVAVLWLQGGGRILLHGWAKRGARGKRKRWTLSEWEIKLT